MTETTAKTVDLHTLVMAGAVGLFGFLANDFVEGRDSRTQSVEAVVREVIDLKLGPLASDFAEIKGQLRDFSNENRAMSDEMRNRLAASDNRIALAERSIEGLEANTKRNRELILEVEKR